MRSSDKVVHLYTGNIFWTSKLGQFFCIHVLIQADLSGESEEDNEYMKVKLWEPFWQEVHIPFLRLNHTNNVQSEILTFVSYFFQEAFPVCKIYDQSCFQQLNQLYCLWLDLKAAFPVKFV